MSVEKFYVVAPTEADFPSGRRECRVEPTGFCTVATCVRYGEVWEFQHHYGFGVIEMSADALRVELAKGGTERIEEVLG